MCSPEKMMKTNEEMKQELELQLHEQYAINNNANVSNFVAMIAALIIAFVGYGTVLYYYLCEGRVVQLLMVVATLTLLGVIAILYILAVQLGSNQRMEQFVTIAIRDKYYSLHDEYSHVFPKGYHPFSKGYFNFVQGVYNTLSRIFLICTIGVAAISYFVFAQCLCAIVASIVIVFLLCLYRYCRYDKYKKREKEYQHITIYKKKSDR